MPVNDPAATVLAMPSHPPKHREASFDCPRCGVFTSQEWADLRTPAQQPFADSDARVRRGSNGSTFLVPMHWTASKCFVCEDWSVWRDRSLIYPPEMAMDQPHEDMPESVRELYNEARAVVGISRRAGAALARGSLERLLKTLDPDAGRVSLDERIARMAERVSASLWQLLTALRHIGNKSLHVDDEPDEAVTVFLGDEDAGISELLFAAVNDLVDELITRPKRAAAIYSKLPNGIRQAAEQKVAKRSNSD